MDGSRRVVRRRRKRSSRRLQLVLLSLGSALISLSAVLLGFGVLRSHHGLVRLGVIYLLASVAVLAVRGALKERDRLRKRTSMRAHPGPDGEPLSTGWSRPVKPEPAHGDADELQHG